jgi:succinylglutamate desuccinylase
LLEAEAGPPERPPFFGRLVGILGHRQGLATGQRFLTNDLNRIWTPENIHRIRQLKPEERKAEDREAAELLDLIHAEILDAQPTTLVLLDLHTTSAAGGVFCIPTDDRASLRLAKTLQVPVILDLFEGVEGTLLRYGVENHFSIGGFPRHTLGVAFEAGQHDDPQSVRRSVSAILHCLEAAGCRTFAEGRPPSVAATPPDAGPIPLPRVARLRHVHSIRPGDRFRMRPGYLNFQPVRSGEHLADDVTGPIQAPLDGLILMPLYQAQGSDGFFIVSELDRN